MNNVATLSLDLDDKWTYLKTHGDSSWKSFPSYFGIAVPRILKILQDHNLRITFFLVGQDLIGDKNIEILRKIVEAGHEIANHSFNHNPWLNLYTKKQIEIDILKTEENLKKISNIKPVGFRGPGYSISKATLEILKKRRYLYDASILPSYIAPLARTYFLLRSKLSREEKNKRKSLFGSFRNGFYPNKPFYWQQDSGKLLEIPVTTLPFLKIPFHASYIIYLCKFYPNLGINYLKFAIKLCKMSKIQPSLLLHPLDFLGSEDEKDLHFFPAMQIPRNRKLNITKNILSVYSAQYKIIPIKQFAKEFFNHT